MADKRLNNPDYKNWMKCVNGLQVVHKGVTPFVRETINQQHKDIGLPQCVKNCKDFTGSICKVCEDWKERVKQKKQSGVEWKNAKPCDCTKTPWEFAKLFMGKGQNKGNKTGPEDTDTSALLMLMKNNKYFKQLLQTDTNDKSDPKISKAIETRNKLLHSPSHEISQAELESNIDIFLAILNIPKLLEYAETKESIVELKELKDYGFDVTPADEVKALNVQMEELTLLVLKNQATPQSAAGNIGDSQLNQAQIEQLQRSIREIVSENEDLKLRFSDKLTELTQKMEELENHKNGKQWTRFWTVAIIGVFMAILISFLMQSKLSSAGTASSPKNTDFKSELNLRMQQHGWQATWSKSRPNMAGWKASVKVTGNYNSQDFERTFESTNENLNQKVSQQEAAEKAVNFLDSLVLKGNENSPQATKTETKENAPPRFVETQDQGAASDSFQKEYANIAVASGVPSGNKTEELNQFIENLSYARPAFSSKNVGGKFQATVKVTHPYLWTVENSVSGKKQAEQEVAKVILRALKEPTPTCSAKEALYVYCGKNKLEKPSYVTYKSWEHEQSFHGVGYFEGCKNPQGFVSFKSAMCDNVTNCYESVAELALTNLKLLNLEKGNVPQNQAALEQNIPTPEKPPRAESLKNNISPSLPSEVNYIGKLKELVEKGGASFKSPEYRQESNGSLYRASVDVQIPRDISENPQKSHPKLKDAEKAVALYALQLDYPDSVPIDISTAKNKLQEICQRILPSNVPKYVQTRNTEQGFSSTVYYIARKEFSGRNWVGSTKQAKQDAAKMAYDALM